MRRTRAANIHRQGAHPPRKQLVKVSHVVQARAHIKYAANDELGHACIGTHGQGLVDKRRYFLDAGSIGCRPTERSIRSLKHPSSIFLIAQFTGVPKGSLSFFVDRRIGNDRIALLTARTLRCLVELGKYLQMSREQSDSRRLRLTRRLALQRHLALHRTTSGQMAPRRHQAAQCCQRPSIRLVHSRAR